MQDLYDMITDAFQSIAPFELETVSRNIFRIAQLYIAAWRQAL